LDGKHTVFGRVIRGQNVVDAIRQGDRIQGITIIRNGTQANAFRADQASFDTLIRNAASAAAARARVQRDAELAEVNRKYPNTTVTASGLRYLIQRRGSGAKPLGGSTAQVNLKGMLLSGAVFANSDLSGGPENLPVGSGRIIPGLDEAILDMSRGERRTVIIPPELAYGEDGLKNQAGTVIIPPNSFLVFEIELVEIR
jgi:peptidylprolyl isomerase